MSKNTRDPNTKTAKIAAPVRTLLRSLIRNKIRTEADKRALADFLERSVSFVNQMVYNAEGSLDAWIGAFVFAYKLDAETLAELFSDQSQAARKMSPLSPADQIWFGLDEILTDDEKFYWVSVVRAAIDLNRDLGVGPPTKSNPATALKAAESPPWTKD